MSIAAFYGGNMESNTIGEVYANGMNHPIFKGVDFEGIKAIATAVDIGACNPVTVEDCNFSYGPASANRAIVLSSCQGGRIINNRVVGVALKNYIVIDENSSKCQAHGNLNFDGPEFYVNNRSAYQ
jgi:hypothetical protein